MRRLSILVLVLPSLPACDGALGTGFAGGAAVPRPGQTYVARRGDTLFHLAEKAYGNGNFWPRIQEANPWCDDPDHLEPGWKIDIPTLDPSDLEVDPNGPVSPIFSVGSAAGAAPYEAPYDPELELARRAGGPRQHSNPGNRVSLWNTLRQRVSGRTFFGFTLDKLFFYVLAGCCLHAIFQGFVVWITSTIAFVKDASLKKSLHATFLTEMLTLCTVGMLGAVGLMMAYAGAADPGGAPGAMLFPSVEEYLRTPGGATTASLGVLALYVILSLRFIPQVFGIQRSQGFTVVFLGVLLPHLAALYLFGQRLAIIQV